MRGTDSVERAIADQRFVLTTAGGWACTWCGRELPDAGMRQLLDAHLRTCTQDRRPYQIQPAPPAWDAGPFPRRH